MVELLWSAFPIDVSRDFPEKHKLLQYEYICTLDNNILIISPIAPDSQFFQHMFFVKQWH